ncbi:Asp-tRNA(Asn)/Glu-tRNA(Gln) amidotransferase GatCAB subunit B [Candidatus Wolfebacteria bacterium]|nr:MAG: Asp-tRNA(Asn)/Glu-tRNA(Gln) amidotransferase GatCAB subunit B [Candidatus Wolfebacteria bacterium]
MSENSPYKATIGLEIHAELKTHTKMFCNSRNNSDEKRPNTNICPVCMSHPGTLPVINREAVKHVMRVGLSVGGDIAEQTYFDRKNYFYPDIPKGYQISQYPHPIVSNGELAGVELTRIHLEEDTAKSTHDTGSSSLVDFNRAGVPLMELVTEPVIHNAADAVAFARELQLLLRYLGAGEANMEKGEMRVEANISISKTSTLGTKVEVKNLNSFRAVERAINYEIARHEKVLERGESVDQVTMGWDESKGKTFTQRAKENSHDYRYFPDPDLPTLDLSSEDDLNLDTLKESLPELPSEKRARYESTFGIKSEDIETYITSHVLGAFFEQVVEQLDSDKALIALASNYITSDIIGLGRSNTAESSIEGVGLIKAEGLAQLIRMVSAGELSSRGAKDILKIMFIEGGYPEIIARDNDLLQKSNKDDLIPIAQGIIESNESVANEYRNGKESSMQFFIGQGMKETKGSANPKILKEVFEELLQK